MKVRVTFDVDKDLRLAFNARFGKPGLASREDIATDIGGHIETIWQDYLYEWQHGLARPDEEEEE